MGGHGRGGRGGSLGTGELQLLDQVLVGNLGETGALLGVQEDVIHPHGHLGAAAASGADASRDHTGDAVRQGEVELHLVVLQGNQGESQAGGLVEEKACIPSLSRYLCQPHRD